MGTTSAVFLLALSAAPSLIVEARRGATFPVATKATFAPPLTLRGGSSLPDSTTSHAPSAPSGYDPYAKYNTNHYDDINYDINYDDDDNGRPLDGGGDGNLLHETVQHRVDAWKSQQRQSAQEVRTSPRDEQGRMKLFISVGKGSRALIFFFLMWRNVHLYEVADQAAKGIVRLALVVPLVLLFFGNLMGVVASLSSPGHAAKRRLKAILNMDKLVEAMLILYSFVRLTVSPSKYVPREVYITNILHSFLFILQCQGFTRLSWDEHSAQPLNSYAQRAPLQQTASQPPYAQHPFSRDGVDGEGVDDDLQRSGEAFEYEDPYGRRGY